MIGMLFESISQIIMSSTMSIVMDDFTEARKTDASVIVTHRCSGSLSCKCVSQVTELSMMPPGDIPTRIPDQSEYVRFANIHRT